MADKPEGPKCYIPRLEMTMREIPDKYHDFLWEYTGGGKAPNVVEAAVEYLESDKTQSDIKQEYGVSMATLRKALDSMVESGVITEGERKEARSGPWYKPEPIPRLENDA